MEQMAMLGMRLSKRVAHRQARKLARKQKKQGQNGQGHGGQAGGSSSADPGCEPPPGYPVPGGSAQQGGDVHVSIDTSDLHPVVMGADAKLTMDHLYRSGVSMTELQRRLLLVFVELQFRVFRIPIYGGLAIRGPNQAQEQPYEELLTVLQTLKEVAPHVELFASIANKEPKFGQHVKSQGKMDPAKYGNYIVSYLSLLQSRGLSVTYLGPFNEDDFGPQALRTVLDTVTAGCSAAAIPPPKFVGLEFWALNKSNKVLPEWATNNQQLLRRLHAVGSHAYDQHRRHEKHGPGDGRWCAATAFEADWARFVGSVRQTNKKLGTQLRAWYSEATRLKQGDNQHQLLGGLQDIFDAVNGGVDGVMVYQAAKRLLNANCIPKPRKFYAYQRLVNDAARLLAGRARSSDREVKAVAFAGAEGGGGEGGWGMRDVRVG